MLFFGAIFLLYIGGAVSTSIAECREREGQNCDRSAIPPGFPQTQEEYDTICQHGLTFLTCTSNVFNKCGVDDDDPESEYVKKLMVYIQRRLCNPESHIYEALSSNLECIELALRKARGVCTEPVGGNQNKMIDALEDYMLERLEVDEQSGRHCMDVFFKVVCTIVITGQKCGTPVGDALLDAVHNADPELQGCPQNVLDDLQHVVNTLRSIAEEAEEIENAIKRRK